MLVTAGVAASPGRHCDGSLAERARGASRGAHALAPRRKAPTPRSQGQKKNAPRASSGLNPPHRDRPVTLPATAFSAFKKWVEASAPSPLKPCSFSSPICLSPSPVSAPWFHLLRTRLLRAHLADVKNPPPPPFFQKHETPKIRPKISFFVPALAGACRTPKRSARSPVSILFARRCYKLAFSP